VDKSESRRDDLCRFGKARELVEPRVRHRDLADVRLDGAERIVRGLRRRRLGQRIEERRLADIRQSDDAALEAHQLSSESSLASPKPFAAIARCTLFWKLASLPAASRSAFDAITSVSASTHGCSSLAKSLSTCGCTSSLTPG